MLRFTRDEDTKIFQLEIIKDDFSLPKENQQIVKVLDYKDNDIFEVQSKDGSIFLVSMYLFFENIINTPMHNGALAQEGSFLIIEKMDEEDNEKPEIVRILTPEHEELFKRENVWPKEFDPPPEENLFTGDRAWMNDINWNWSSTSESEESFDEPPNDKVIFFIKTEDSDTE